MKHKAFLLLDCLSSLSAIEGKQDLGVMSLFFHAFMSKTYYIITKNNTKSKGKLL